MSSLARGLKEERKTSRRERGHQAELHHAGRSARTIVVKILARRNDSSSKLLLISVFCFSLRLIFILSCFQIFLFKSEFKNSTDPSMYAKLYILFIYFMFCIFFKFTFFEFNSELSFKFKLNAQSKISSMPMQIFIVFILITHLLSQLRKYF